ncbi:MAG: hypothetical protein JRJ84_12085 [Deltaproteobacteria bacterium]|nr:hypothetical protein [Deltaproteobacteria bacterium]
MGRERLNEVLKRIEATVASKRLPMVVLDLDSTLFSTAHRNLRILREFADEFADDYPRLRDHVNALGPRDMSWQVLDAVRARGYDPSDLERRFRPYWMERFFTDAYVKDDHPNLGAVAFANACHERGALLYYLTGRHKGGMELGTAQSLSMNGFPYWRGRAVLHLKPAFDMPDLEYKEHAVADIRSYLSPVVATFENEPGNANLFLRAFPDGLHFLLETEHSPEAESPDPKLIRIPDFRLPGGRKGHR